MFKGEKRTREKNHAPDFEWRSRNASPTGCQSIVNGKLSKVVIERQRKLLKYGTESIKKTFLFYQF